MDFKKHKVVARFPNGLMQLEIEPSKNRNKYVIVNKKLEPIIEEYFSGMVYLNPKKFEVYKDNSSILGILDLDTGLDWEVETPNEIRNKITKKYRLKIVRALEHLTPNCVCAYPRIIDYIENRKCTDGAILQDQMMRISLYQSDEVSTEKTDEYIRFLNCKNCGSKYKHRYKERNIDQLEVVELKPEKIIGKAIKVKAPNYLDGYIAEVFYKKNYLSRKKLYKASEQELFEYLFAEKNKNKFSILLEWIKSGFKKWK